MLRVPNSGFVGLRITEPKTNDGTPYSADAVKSPQDSRPKALGDGESAKSIVGTNEFDRLTGFFEANRHGR